MSTKTTNLELTKPDPTENYDVEVFNANYDLIDGAIGDMETQKSNKLVAGDNIEITENELDKTVTISVNNLFDIVYPINSIYLSVSNINPAAIFGGTWLQIKDIFLLAAGDIYNNGDTGGEANHQLKINELPKFTPNISITEKTLEGTFKARAQDIYTTGIVSGTGGDYSDGNADNNRRERLFKINATHTHEITVNEIGGDIAHNNMPPYLAVYMWKRTA